MKKLLIGCSVLVLFALLSLLMGASATKSLVIDVSEDTYAVADLNDPDDSLGFRDENYGDLEFVKAWYFWNVVEEEVIPEGEEGEEAEPEIVETEYEKVVSIIYLKFDLAELQDIEIESAMLQLYSHNVALLAPRYMQALQVDSDWDELTLTFDTAPTWAKRPGHHRYLSSRPVVRLGCDRRRDSGKRIGADFLSRYAPRYGQSLGRAGSLPLS